MCQKVKYGQKEFGDVVTYVAFCSLSPPALHHLLNCPCDARSGHPEVTGNLCRTQTELFPAPICYNIMLLILLNYFLGSFFNALRFRGHQALPALAQHEPIYYITELYYQYYIYSSN